MRMRLIAILLAPLWLANCATVVEGTDQSVQVTSHPTGASCDLIRAGASLGSIASTPGAVKLRKAREPIQVVCSKEGHLSETAYLQSGLKGTTFGNILLGGIIGAAIDAGSGAMYEYPTSIKVQLPPETFPTPEARDAYFSDRMASVREEGEAAKKTIRDQCSVEEGDNKGCVDQQKKVDEQVKEQLERLGSQQQSAKIGS